MKIFLAQINPTVGALEWNRDMIMESIHRLSPEADLIVFPELVLTGYPPQDLLTESHFIRRTEEVLQEIADSVANTVVILGTIRQENNALYNTAAILCPGASPQFRDKTLLPTYDVFDEDRYFTPAGSIHTITIPTSAGIKKIGVEICEDLWDREYPKKVTRELAKQHPDVIINISASPYSVNKVEERIRLVTEKVRETGIPFLYCNLTGAQDELIFDGGSFAVNDGGELTGVANLFEEDTLMVDTENMTVSRSFSPLPWKEEVFRALTLGVRDYFAKTGFKKAVLGLSGGIDSALTAVIAVNALGKENVTGVAMPSQYSSRHSVDDARTLAENLGIRFEIIPIRESFQKLLTSLSPFFENTESGLAEENLQARIRGNILMAAANKTNALVLNTGNKTEVALGYCTLYGDMCGALAVIGDLNKLEVYSISRWINDRTGRSVIPESTLTKPPSAELRPDQVDPFDYDRISPLIDAVITEKKHLNSLVKEGYDPELVKDILRKVRINEYKRRQSAPVLRISNKAFGIGRRYPIVNGFRE